MAKLTKPQLELLMDAAYGTFAVKAYAPARKLVEAGLAAWRDDDEYGGTLVVTDAGLAALPATPSHPKGREGA